MNEYNEVLIGFLRVAVGVSIKPFSFPSPLLQETPASVTCVAATSEDVKFDWIKNGDSLREDKTRVSVLGVGPVSTLIITKTKPDDEGNYTCVAKTSSKTAHYTATLILSSEPVWVKEPHDRLLSEMVNEVTIDCVAKSNPLSKITWKSDGGECERIEV